MDRLRHLISYTLSVCQAHMETDVNRNAIDAKMAPSVTTSLVSFHIQEMLRPHNKKEIRELKYLGQCRCLPGWKGDDCSVPCPANTWGIACAQRCTCLHNGTCRPNDGQCRCHDGWMGPQCNESKKKINKILA